MNRILYLYGGWPGHTPYGVSDWTKGILAELGLADSVTESNDIFCLDADLRDYDLIILGWNNALTTEDLTPAQESSLLGAIENGTGVVAWHGAAAAFRSSLQYHLMLGGSFLEHPGGEAYPQPFKVTIADPSHEITRGVSSFDAATEQYYMSVDPNNHVLATTEFNGDHLPWLEGHTCPVAWTRRWGKGRVFYHAMGHFISDLDEPNTRRMTQQGIAWAIRNGVTPALATVRPASSTDLAAEPSH
jgi:type 1 glutamine amidotransferase